MSDQPYLIPASSRPALERMGILRQDGDRCYVGRDWVIFEEPMTVDALPEVVVNPAIPPGTVAMFQDGKIVGLITNVTP